MYFYLENLYLADLTENPRLRTWGSETHTDRESKEKDIRIERGSGGDRVEERGGRQLGRDGGRDYGW